MAMVTTRMSAATMMAIAQGSRLDLHQGAVDNPVRRVGHGSRRRRLTDHQHGDRARSPTGDDDRPSLPGRRSAVVPGRRSAVVPGRRSAVVPGRRSAVVPGRQCQGPAVPCRSPGRRSAVVPGRRSAGDRPSCRGPAVTSAGPGRRSASRTRLRRSAVVPGRRSAAVPGRRSAASPRPSQCRRPSQLPSQCRSPRRRSAVVPGRRAVVTVAVP